MNNKYSFEVIPKSWAKRRSAVAEPVPISIEIPDFELKEQHFCNMHVTFDDGNKQSFYSRVLCNHITKQWTVDGMQVAVKVLGVSEKH